MAKISLRKRQGLAASMAVLTIALAVPTVAAEQKSARFTVTSQSIHADAERAEVCLTFSTSLAVEDRAALAGAIQLEKSGSKMAVTGRDLSVTPSELCVQQLEHRRSYRIAFKNLRDKDGRALTPAYANAFTVPGRPPSLMFSGGNMVAGMPRVTWNDKGAFDLATLGSVQSVNVPAAGLKLFRINEQKNFAAAWQQYAQVSLAPSESLYFASHNGALLWSGNLAFGDAPDKTQSLAAPLPGGDVLKPGLYFLAVTPQDETAANPGLLAGQWFTVADVRLTAVIARDGLHVFASNAAAVQAAGGVALQAVAADGKVLAAGKTGGDGVAVLALDTAQLAQVTMVTGVAADGGAALLPLSTAPQTGMMMPVAARDATMVLDRAAYQPGSVATVTLWARDAQGRSQKTANSSLKLVRPDDNFYNEQPVPADQTGPLFLRVPLPMTGQAGDWLLLWQQADGTVLARQKVRVTADAAAGHIVLSADRDALDADGAFTLTVKAADNAGKPLAFRSGRVFGEATRPEFPAWKKYAFGLTPAAGNEAEKPLGHFITGSDGVARLKLRWPAAAAGRAVRLKAAMDQAVDTANLLLPAQAEAGWAGVKPAADKSVFGENSVAQFDVLALDSAGKKQSSGALYFQIYEEGRSFKWLQEDGHWDYQPLPQHRRIGGGRLAVTAGGEAHASWPVTAGNYALEITDESGSVLTQYNFDAGGALPSVAAVSDDRLVFAPPASLDAGVENTLTVTLAQPAMVATLIGSGTAAQTGYRAMAAGRNQIVVTPGARWDNSVPIWISAVFADGQSATMTSLVPLQKPAQTLAIAVNAATADAGATLQLPVTVQRTDKAPVSVAALATPMTADGGTKIPSVTQNNATLDDKGRASLSLAVPDFSGAMPTRVLAWSEDGSAQQDVAIAVKQGLRVEGGAPGPLHAGDKMVFTATLGNDGAADGAYSYAITGPEAIRFDGTAKGSVVLKAGQSRVLRFALTAKAAIDGILQLEVTGPGHKKETVAWPLDVRDDAVAFPQTVTASLAPQQILALPLKIKTDAKKKSDEPVAALVSPMPLFDVPRLLAQIVAADPYKTAALAEWCDVTRRWFGPMDVLGIGQQDTVAGLRRMRIAQLLQRQHYDGSFPAQPGEEAGDLSSTVAALKALKDEAPMEAQQAAKWVRHYLDNTWFEEPERAARAAAFQAVGLAGLVDSSALRYFADTSSDKNLPPMAAAALALALAQNHDDDAARAWLERTRNGLAGLINAKTVDSWPVLALLAQNSLFGAPDTAELARQAFDADASLPYAIAIARLQTADILAQRAGVWHPGINGPIRNLRGVYAVSLREKGASLALKAPANVPLSILQTETASDIAHAIKGPAALTVQRQLYHLDGSAVGGQEHLQAGQVYLLMLHGTSRNGDGKNGGERVIVNEGSAGLALLPAGSADAAAFASAWPWLPPLTNWQGMVVTPTALQFAIPAADEWRAVALVRAKTEGTFTLPAVIARDAAGLRMKTSSAGLPFAVDARQ